MAEPTRARLPDGARVASIACGAMIAQQVAGKATRDALYLSHFDVKTLPAVMAASAALSLLAMVGVSRSMVRHTPARVVPVAFAASGAAFLLEWGLSFPAPGAAAIAVYIHTALFGAVVISAFWSLVNETFVPHSGRSAVSWIAGGGTLGGALASLAAWRAAGVIAVPTMLPLLAAVNLVCLWGVLRLRRPRPEAAAPPGGGAREPTFAPLRVLRDSPYLRNLALVVALGAATSGLLDYLFSAAAVRTHTQGQELLAFFALFWLAVGVLSFVLQVTLGRLALARLGLAGTTALLPGVVVLGGALGLALPGLWSMAILRGGEATQRNSLFRAAYELLYTPLAEQTKRSAKALIDVGFDRLGTVSASAIAALILALVPAGRADVVLLVVAMGCALVGLARTRALHRGYVALLEEGLAKAAPQLEREAAAPTVPLETPAPTLRPQAKIAVRDEVVEHLDELRSRDPGGFGLATGEEVREEAAPVGELGALSSAVLALTSGNADRIRKVLGAEAPLPAPLVGFAILLLSDKALHDDAIRALRKVAKRATGQLVDALCDPSLAFDIRRRIPRVLGECSTQDAADGLLRGLDDDRFEVRYACGRALLKIVPDPAITITRDRVVAATRREVERAKAVWESQDEEEDNESTRLFDRLLRDRIDRSMEHVFNVLALHLDPDSLRTAFNALHSDDPQLHGTALEYLETVLPEEVRELVWPFLGEARPMRPARPAHEILADIVRSRKAGTTGA